jgi:hypothetical protein
MTNGSAGDLVSLYIITLSKKQHKNTQFWANKYLALLRFLQLSQQMHMFLLKVIKI